jgi:hypothetical protein
MATRMQQRRGTAAQWISTNAGAGPVLNAGEIGWESDTNKFKIGDGVNNWTSLDYFADINSTVNPAFGSSITFEGATADSYETVLQVTDPTADRTITLPNVTGTVITTGNLSDITDIGVFTSTIVMEGSSADDHELTLSAGNPTADRTITFPDSTGTVALTSDITVTASSTNTFTNKSISLTTNTLSGTLAELNTAISDADVASLATAQTLTNKTIALGSNTVSGTLAEFNTAVTDANLVSLDGSETLTNKTLTSPVISTITNSGTLTLPTSTGTIALTTDIPAGVVTESGTQTLTNKTLTSPVVSGLTLSDSSIVIEGSTANDFETTLTVTDPTADRTITLPDVTGTVVTTGNLSAITSVGTLASLTVTGDLTVNGTTTTINSTTLTVDDKNIVLGDVETPTDTTADGGGITLKGATDKTFNWVDATDSWTSSEHLFLSATKELRLADTDSSHYVGFKSPGTVTANKVWVLPAADGTAGQALSTDGSGNLSWATSGGGAAFSEFMLIGA